jgi:large subunit ribosomal protein L9
MVFKSILLLKNIQKLGCSGDVIKVRGGYARNFLLPNKLAIMISRKNSKYINHRKNIVLSKNILKESNLKILAEKLESMKLTIYSDITSRGRLFGSITPKDISRHLKTYNISIDYKQISVSSPIKSIGSHKITIDLGASISSTLTIDVKN